jgi:hypothetical protein
VLAADGSWVEALFLVDTGADATVFDASLMANLKLAPVALPGQLGGLGGRADAVVVETQLALPHEGGNALLRGRYAGVTAPEALEMSVLGLDLRDVFAFIVDWPGRVVCLLHPPHGYHIEVQET